MPIIIPSSPSVEVESLILDGLDLNDGTLLTLEELSLPAPRKKAEWITGADSDGAILARDPLFEPREITARVRVEQRATMNSALDAIAAISDKLEEAERHASGIPLVWSPAQSPRELTFYVLSGEITEMPIVVAGQDAGWFVIAPVMTVVLACRPFGYGAEVVGAPVTSTEPIVTREITGVTGDIPAEGRIIVTDAATQARRLVRWGVWSRYYPTTAPPGLLLDSASLVTAGFAGAQATRAGAYGAGNNVIRGTLAGQPAAVCGTGNQPHVGTFRVFARVFTDAAASDQVFVRLAWQDGDGPLRANAYATPPAVGAFAEVNLGLVTATTAVLGTQRWSGRIEAYSTVAERIVDVDYLLLVPAGEGYGEARGVAVAQPGVIYARDSFTITTTGTGLAGRVAPLGGAWTTVGATTDFIAVDGPDAGEETVRRTTTADSASGRIAVFGAAQTDSEVRARVKFPAGLGPGGAESTEVVELGVVARYVDTANYFAASLRTVAYLEVSLQVTAVVAGVTTVINEIQLPGGTDRDATVKLIVYASGAFHASALVNDSTVGEVRGSRTELATGGALASGRAGVRDYAANLTTGVARHYDDVFASTPVAEPNALHSGRRLELRHDSAWREDAAGTYWGSPPAYRGARVFLPPAGVAGRKALVAVVARRNDTVTMADDQIADSTTVQVNYRPRFLHVPR